MTTTPPESSITDSWVDLAGQVPQMSSPLSLSGAVTPTRRVGHGTSFGGEMDYLRMLREAQRESNRSSTKVSPISSAFISGRNSPSMSPKSPPNTPNPELASSLQEELKAVYINHTRYNNEHTTNLSASDILWDWSSRPNIPHSREWTITSVRSRKSSSSSKLSSPNNKDGKKPSRIFSKGVVYTILITNLVSIIIGAGIGIWLSKRGVSEDVVLEISV